MSLCTYTPACIHTYVRTYMHTYTYIYTCMLLQLNMNEMQITVQRRRTKTQIVMWPDLDEEYKLRPNTQPTVSSIENVAWKHVRISGDKDEENGAERRKKNANRKPWAKAKPCTKYKETGLNNLPRKAVYVQDVVTIITRCPRFNRIGKRETRLHIVGVLHTSSVRL